MQRDLRCSARPITTDSNLLPLPGIDESFFLTDQNWTKGVAKKWAGYFVPAQWTAHKVGAKVRLKNGEIRTIVRVQQQGKYLNVFLDGPPLDPAVHGYPPEFRLIE